MDNAKTTGCGQGFGSGSAIDPHFCFLFIRIQSFLLTYFENTNFWPKSSPGSGSRSENISNPGSGFVHSSNPGPDTDPHEMDANQKPRPTPLLITCFVGAGIWDHGRQ